MHPALYWLLHRNLILALNALLLLVLLALWISTQQRTEGNGSFPTHLVGPVLSLIVVGWNLRQRPLIGAAILANGGACFLVYPFLLVSMIQVPNMPFIPFAQITLAFFVIPLLSIGRLVFHWRAPSARVAIEGVSAEA